MKITCVTSLRDEGPYLLEWLAHHKAIGVTDFLIFSNDCTDGADEMLDELEAYGEVTHLRQQKSGEKSIQWQAMKTASQHPLVTEADWVLHIDLDEFVNIQCAGGRFPDLFENIGSEFDAIVLPWRLFGANRIHNLIDKPTTTQFTKSAPYPLIYPFAATLFKTLYRPSAFRELGVHRPKTKKGQKPKWRNADGGELAPHVADKDNRLSLFGAHCTSPLVYINHYSLRSAASFLLKRERGLPNRKTKHINIDYWLERNYNIVEDNTILRTQSARAAETTRLRGKGSLASSHTKSFELHKEKFERLLRTSQGYSLYSKIVTAESRPVSEAEGVKLYRLFQQLRP